MGFAGPGTFTQSGGSNAVNDLFFLGNAADVFWQCTTSTRVSSPRAANTSTWAISGTGSFNQSGGTNLVNGLYLGDITTASAKYSLSGSGSLSAADEYVGYASAGTLTQTGGSNSAAYLNIGSQGRYQLSGGTLQVNSLVNQGVLDGSGGYGLLVASSGSIVDLSKGSIVNAGSLALTINTNSLLLLPSGSSTAAFHSYTSAGLLHDVGTPLTVSSGTGFSGNGSISDHVTCYGTISAASGGAINLNSGVTVSTTGSTAGSVNLGSGSFTVNDAISGIGGGSLWAGSGYVGYSGTGTFNQSGGTNTLTSGLVLGGGTADSGTYQLSGVAVLSASSEQVALGGAGTFTQTGGTNGVSSALYLGPGAGRRGDLYPQQFRRAGRAHGVCLLVRQRHVESVGRKEHRRCALRGLQLGRERRHIPPRQYGLALRG